MSCAQQATPNSLFFIEYNYVSNIFIKYIYKIIEYIYKRLFIKKMIYKRIYLFIERAIYAEWVEE